MKISELIKELQSIEEEHGDVEAQIQDDGEARISGVIDSFPDFFVVPEEYFEQMLETAGLEIVNVIDNRQRTYGVKRAE